MSDTVYGLLARFDDADALTKAARTARDEGYTRLEAYLPYPSEAVAEALGHTDNRVGLTALISAVLAAAAALLLQVLGALDYPFNVSGKPVLSWPAFAIVTFAVGMLGATFGALVAMLAINRLPRPHHPLFNAALFDRASRDGLFLCIEADDPQFDAAAARDFLHSLGAAEILEVPS